MRRVDAAGTIEVTFDDTFDAADEPVVPAPAAPLAVTRMGAGAIPTYGDDCSERGWRVLLAGAGHPLGHVVGQAEGRRPLVEQGLVVGGGQAVVDEPLDDAAGAGRVGGDLGGQRVDGGVEVGVGDGLVDQADGQGRRCRRCAAP